MKKLVRTALAIIIITIFIFLTLGFLFASKANRQWVDTLWVVTITVIAVAIIAATLAVIGLGIANGVTAFLHKNQLRHRIFPDENGNLPVFRQGRRWVNANLIGVEKQPHAWMLWQPTNNRLPGPHMQRRLINEPLPLLPAGEPERMPLINARGQSDVIDAVAEEIG